MLGVTQRMIAYLDVSLQRPKNFNHSRAKELEEWVQQGGLADEDVEKYLKVSNKLHELLVQRFWLKRRKCNPRL